MAYGHTVYISKSRISALVTSLSSYLVFRLCIACSSSLNMYFLHPKPILNLPSQLEEEISGLLKFLHNDFLHWRAGIDDAEVVTYFLIMTKSGPYHTWCANGLLSHICYRQFGKRTVCRDVTSVWVSCSRLPDNPLFMYILLSGVSFSRQQYWSPYNIGKIQPFYRDA